MSKFKKGDTVVQVLPEPIKGIVSGFSVDQETGDVLVSVTWDEGEHKHIRHFTEDQLK